MRRRHSRARAVRRRMRFLIAEGSHEGSQKVVMHAAVGGAASVERGRSWLGEMIEQNGFYDVFIITFWLGGVAVALSALEWARQAYLKR